MTLIVELLTDDYYLAWTVTVDEVPFNMLDDANTNFLSSTFFSISIF